MDNSKRESHAQAVIDIVKAVSNMQDVSPETEITTMNMDSITFIKIIVALEDAFEIEFDSRKLKYISFFNVDELIDSNKINEIEELGIVAFPYVTELYEAGSTELEPLVSRMQSKVKLSDRTNVKTTDVESLSKEIETILVLE